MYRESLGPLFKGFMVCISGLGLGVQDLGLGFPKIRGTYPPFTPGTLKYSPPTSEPIHHLISG